MSIPSIPNRKRPLTIQEGERPKKKRKICEDSPNLKIHCFVIQNVCGFRDSMGTQSVAATAQNRSETNKVDPYTQLYHYYQIDFNSPPNSEKCKFFELRDQLILLETVLNVEHQEKIRNHIKTILNGTLSHQEKMAELGIIFYYLEKENQLPDPTASYTQTSGQQMCLIIEKLKEQKKLSGIAKNAHVASGKMDFILRSLIQMMITEKQQLNCGAIYAAILFLETHSTLSRHLKSEHRDSILHVLKQILTQPQFKRLLEKKTEVHRDLQDLIRFDLKMSPDAPVTSVHAVWAALMAVLYDLRQTDMPNCYSVSHLIYALQNGTYKVLSQLITWLQNGYYNVFSSQKIPIFPLIEKALIFTKDLKLELTPESAASLATVQKIAYKLGFEHVRMVIDGTEKITVRGFLKKIVSSENHAPFVEKMYDAFKHNSLTILLLSLTEFYEANIAQDSQNFNSQKKDELFKNLLKPLSNQLPFLLEKRIQKKLNEKIWIGNYPEREKPTRILEAFEGNAESLERVLRESRRVFLLQKGKYHLIESFSRLRTILKSITRNAATELRYNRNAIRKYKALVNHEYCRKVAGICASQINKKGIKAKFLLNADLFLFRQNGGRSSLLFPGPFDLSSNFMNLSAKNISEFLNQLRHFLKRIDKDALAKTPVLLVQLGSHIFTMKPFECEPLMQNKVSDKIFVHKTIFTPASFFLRTSIPKEIVNAVITRYINKFDKNNKTLQSLFDAKDSLTYASFYRSFKQAVNSKKIHEIAKIIDDEYYKINVTPFYLRIILKKLEIHLTHEQFKLMDGALVKFSQARHYPFQYALFLRKQLIQYNCPVLNPRMIEKAICETFRLPLVFDIADYNWAHSNKEDPFHCRLVIRYHFGYQTPLLFVRYKDKEKVEEKKGSIRFGIYHSNILKSEQ